MFVRLLRGWFPVYALAVLVGFSFDGVTTGRWTLAGGWAVVWTTNILLLKFRTRLFIRAYAISSLLLFASFPAMACVNYGTRGYAKTYTECVQKDYQSLAPIFWLFCAVVTFVAGRQFASVAFAWRAARAAIALHRHALLLLCYSQA